jgi:hypothetical protein
MHSLVPLAKTMFIWFTINNACIVPMILLTLKSLGYEFFMFLIYFSRSKL